MSKSARGLNIREVARFVFIGFLFGRFCPAGLKTKKAGGRQPPEEESQI